MLTFKYKIKKILLCFEMVPAIFIVMLICKFFMGYSMMHTFLLIMISPKPSKSVRFVY